MKFAALLVLFSFHQAPDTVEYKNPELNLAFKHPKSWDFKTDKKGVTHVTIAVPGADQKATMDIYSVTFNADEDIWQNVQKDFLVQMKRQVVRQWKEEILGVPLLMTRGGYETKAGTQMAILTGLVYSRSPRKLLFRLTSPAQGYDSIEFDLRNSLQTLHTIDGTLPSPEDPTRKITPEEAKVTPVLAPPKVTIISTGKVHSKLVKGALSQGFKAGGKDVVLRFETGWKVTTDSNGVSLGNPGLPGVIHIAVNSVLDSDPPDTAMLKASATSLNDFTTVASRTETNPTPNKAGALTSVIWRMGKGAKGDIVSCEAVGVLGENYWLATYEYNGDLTPVERKLMDALFAGMSVEPTP